MYINYMKFDHDFIQMIKLYANYLYIHNLTIRI